MVAGARLRHTQDDMTPGIGPLTDPTAMENVCHLRQNSRINVIMTDILPQGSPEAAAGWKVRAKSYRLLNINECIISEFAIDDTQLCNITTDYISTSTVWRI